MRHLPTAGDDPLFRSLQWLASYAHAHRPAKASPCISFPVRKSSGSGQIFHNRDTFLCVGSLALRPTRCVLAGATSCDTCFRARTRRQDGRHGQHRIERWNKDSKV